MKKYLKARIEYLKKQEQRALKNFPDSISTQEVRYLKERREELEEALKQITKHDTNPIQNNQVDRITSHESANRRRGRIATRLSNQVRKGGKEHAPSYHSEGSQGD